jgi:hypothetical protein
VVGEDRDWQAWHTPYDEAGSAIADRLIVVQRLIAEAITAHRGPMRAISACAGQGRDLLGVLADHPRGNDVTARLVELDAGNASAARAAAEPFAGVEVVTGDASTTDAFAGAVPADLILMCGVFGNVSDEDVKRTIDLLPTLCAAGATVIWTRHRKPPDLTSSIDHWFNLAGFDWLTIESPPDHPWVGVGAHRLRIAPQPFRPKTRMFSFL